VAGFWKAPRVLARMRAERVLTASAYTLINFLGQSGADRPEGIVTTNGYLASTLEISDKSVRRSLHDLRDLGLIKYTDHAGVAPFRVRTSVTDWESMTDPVTEPVTDVTSVTPAELTLREPASAARKPAVTTSVTSRARAETETETSPRSLGVGPNGPAETAPTTPQQAASSARYCRFPFVRPEGEGTFECGHRCRDEVELADHLRNVHGVAPKPKLQAVSPPAHSRLGGDPG
jgi:hypothetical protein